MECRLLTMHPRAVLVAIWDVMASIDRIDIFHAADAIDADIFDAIDTTVANDAIVPIGVFQA